jgi:hypothetical protein
MMLRRIRGQSVAEFLLTFIVLWAMLLLVYGVCALWNARVTSVYAAIDGACREAVASGSGVSAANADMYRLWPNQQVRTFVMSEQDEYDVGVTIVKTTVQGQFIVPWLIDTFGYFLPNAGTLKAVASCPKQQFVPRPK